VKTVRVHLEDARAGAVFGADGSRVPAQCVERRVVVERIATPRNVSTCSGRIDVHVVMKSLMWYDDLLKWLRREYPDGTSLRRPTNYDEFRLRLRGKRNATLSAGVGRCDCDSQQVTDRYDRVGDMAL
jgi:hypothetical protein